MAASSGPGYSPAPLPANPTRWLYDRNGDPTTLQEYGHYVRAKTTKEAAAHGSTYLVQTNPDIPQGSYLSPERAAEKNPKVWIYDSNGKAIKQVFKGGEGPDTAYDTGVYNLGPDSVPYRHWYDVYGVSQGYAPVSTPMPSGYYESPNQAPKSSVYQAPASYDKVDSNYTVQGSNPEGFANTTGNQTNSGTVDLANIKLASKKRKAAQNRQLTLLGSNDLLGGSSSTDKTLLGG